MDRQSRRDHDRTARSLSSGLQPSAVSGHAGLRSRGAARRNTDPRTKRYTRLSNDAFDNFAMHVREAEISALEAVRQLQMIQPEQMQNGRIQIVNMHFVLGGIE